MNSLSAKNDWLLSISALSQLKTVPKVSSCSTMRSYLRSAPSAGIPTEISLSFVQPEKLNMGPDIALCRRSIVVVLQKKWHIAATAQKNLGLQLFSPWDFVAFHSFQTLEKPPSLARKGLPLFLALTLTFIVTDENIRPQNVAIVLLIRISYPL